MDVEQGLGACISRIRIALSDNARNPRYIETLPRRGYRFLVPVEGLPPPRRLMLAVLVFDNLSGNPQEDYFCEGLTEEIITEVACLNGEKLGVIARTSVSRFKDEKKDVREIGRQLDVDYILEGSVRRQGDRARITYGLLGKRSEAEVVLGQLRELSRRKYVSSYLPAKVYAALGEKDKAFAALDRAMEERSDWLGFVKVDPCLDPLRTDARFQQLLRGLRLPESRL